MQRLSYNIFSMFLKMWYSFVIFNAFIFFMSFLTFIFCNTKIVPVHWILSPFCCNCLILDAFLTQQSEPDWIILIFLVVFSSEMQLRCGICCLRLLWVGIWVSACLCTYTHAHTHIHPFTYAAMHMTKLKPHISKCSFRSHNSLVAVSPVLMVLQIMWIFNCPQKGRRSILVSKKNHIMIFNAVF